ncbi:hypothetical protein TNCV_1348591 [Trichonephila clavipes]|nr:hypothetical protein TNCV_1348591 [Trichonephila clavipes]
MEEGLPPPSPLPSLRAPLTLGGSQQLEKIRSSQLPGCSPQTSRREDRHIVRNAANYFIGRHPDKGGTFKRSLCVFLNHMKAPGRRTFGTVAPIACPALDAHLSTPPFEVVPRTKKL